MDGEYLRFCYETAISFSSFRSGSYGTPFGFCSRTCFHSALVRAMDTSITTLSEYNFISSNVTFSHVQSLQSHIRESSQAIARASPLNSLSIYRYLITDFMVDFDDLITTKWVCSLISLKSIKMFNVSLQNIYCEFLEGCRISEYPWRFLNLGWRRTRSE